MQIFKKAFQSFFIAAGSRQHFWFSLSFLLLDFLQESDCFIDVLTFV